MILEGFPRQSHSMRVSFPPRGKEFGAGDFCEPRLRLTSAAVKDADKRVCKAEKINTGPRPAMSSFAYRPLNRTEDRGRAACFILPLMASHEACRSAGTYKRSARWLWVTMTT